MSAPRILAFAGSLRKDSYNKKLVQIAAGAARRAGAAVTYIDLKDYPLPIFDEDLEKSAGLPENGRKLKQLFLDHDGLLGERQELIYPWTDLSPGAAKWEDGGRGEVVDHRPRIESWKTPWNVTRRCFSKAPIVSGVMNGGCSWRK